LSLFPDNVARPEYICRSSSTEPIEYQANRFASCLLMTRDMVKNAWQEWHGNLDSIYLPDLRAEVGDAEPDELVLENAIRPLATTFQVSLEVPWEGLKERNIAPIVEAIQALTLAQRRQVQVLFKCFDRLSRWSGKEAVKEKNS
jgi:IrrE N-terminal-like domain